MTEEEKKKKAAQDAASAANVPTYAEFVAQNENIGVSPVNIQQPITYGEGNKTALQLIEEQKNASYAAAQAQRERAIIDAKTSYAQNLATYGKNAEALAGSGLAGGGYGEYLGASAYAQQRADIQAAKAAESAAKNTADRVYYADMAAQTEKANAAYLTLMDAAKSGGYTAEEIRAAAQKQGITSEEDIKALAGEAKAFKYAEFAGDISYGAADTKAIDKSFAKGDISEEQYNELKNTWNSDIDTGKSFFYSDGALLSRKDAEEALAEISKNEWLSEENKQKLEDEFKKLYGAQNVTTNGVTFNNDGSFLFFGSNETGKEGNNFSVKDANGNKYRVEYGGAANEDVNNAARELEDNTVFGYKHKIYIKINGKAYRIRKRAGTFHDHYDELYQLLF